MERRTLETNIGIVNDTVRRIAKGEIVSNADMGLALGAVAGLEQYVMAVPEAERDPWKHRSARMSCATCMWFVAKAAPAVVEREPGEPVNRTHLGGGTLAVSAPLFGRCRRHAPTMSGYPAVYGTDWCGDHKLDEAKA